ncbi:isopentenyl-diphosphate delta-isomerase [Gaoshiqia sediminis]|uniref:Isopentenyl-diphosphate delta-isomerase n=1 Tax=Gaoshiqia sediminis TaxID=2986998 RepID=A0AA41Y2X6_9BACT|nr:isopentenyl-diphosphate delta-isomerase [Gaoshiqia sediminis]MCW0482466.1 isopentenyl-diphosphate delta-isomerase [Gaoshiqia sediminis]
MDKDRKLEHIQLAFDSKTGISEQDPRFIYEPLLAAHPDGKTPDFPFLGKRMKAPVWVSSMTGGTGVAKTINRNIAGACREFGLGMGLGSCRKILFDKTHWEDFDVRDEIGPDAPLWANLGVAQVEQLLYEKKEQAIVDLVGELRADGLIVHVNPFQEYFQPEGDLISQPPLETIQELLAKINVPLIVKEVGQGMGRESLKQLLQLPLAAIEFGAYGGTNFSRLELMRDDPRNREIFEPFAFVGQTARQMVNDINSLLDETKPVCGQLIISGGLKTYLDGYYLVSLSRLPAVYGMASSVLKHATGDYETLKTYIENQLKAYRLAQTYLRLNPDYER